MSLNEVNWRSVFSDHKSFPPDVEFQVNNNYSSIIQQKFLCHKLLLSVVSPVFQSQFFSEVSAAGLASERLVVVINDCNPAAFQKMLEFIYYQKPYKLNSSKQVSDKEGISLVMDTMHLAIKFKIRKLATFCEETVNKTVVVNSQNYKEVQKLLMTHKELGKIHRDLCEKFGSVVNTRLSRDKKGVEPVKKREIVEDEVELFRRGLPSKVMDNKRSAMHEDQGPRSRSPEVEPSVINIIGKSEDVVILKSAPSLTNFARSNSSTSSSAPSHLSVSTPRAPEPDQTSLMKLTTPAPVLGPFPSPVPTSLLSDRLSSPLLSSHAFSFPPPYLHSLAYSDLWKPRSTSTPVPVVVSTKMLQNILTSVAGVKEDTSEVLVLTKEELKTLVLKFKDLSEPEKQELFEYVKMMQVKDPEMIKSIRNDLR
jgi:hypothetical protein